MGMKINNLELSSALKKVLESLDENQDQEISITEVDKNSDGFIDSTKSSHFKNSNRAFLKIQNTLFNHRLIYRKFGNVKDFKNTINETPSQNTYNKNELITPLPLTTPLTQNAHEILDDFYGVYLGVMKDGNIQHVYLSHNDLKENTHFEIDGWISSMIVFGKENSNSFFRNAKKLDPEKSFRVPGASGMISETCLSGTCNAVIHHDHLLKAGVPEEVLKHFFTDSENTEQNYLSYNGFQRYGKFFNQVSSYGMPLITQENADLHLVGGPNNNQWLIGFKQKQPNVILQEESFGNGLSSDHSTLTQLEYIGDRGYLALIPDSNLKMNNIFRGIDNVNYELGHSYNHSALVVESDKENAFADQEKRQIVVLTGLLDSSTPEEIYHTTVHEMLHYVASDVGFTENVSIKEFYANLKGLSNEAKQSLTKGNEEVFGDFISDYDNASFFAFINEKNYYFGESTSGHSNSNIYEFLTSFLHSLFDIHKFKENLKQPLRMTSNDFNRTEILHTLTDEEKSFIIKTYKDLISLLIDSIQLGNDKAGRIKSFLREKQECLNNMFPDIN